jgi:Tol biopolymer transport system component
MPLLPGTRLGAYDVSGLIGEGGMGEVYRAHDTRLNRDVAIKVLSSQLAQDPEALARFEREAMSVAKLSHPNILSIHEFGQHERTAFVVTELLDGETLRARLAVGPLPQRRAVGYALQIARGIAAAHARGIVHRDLKPDNVMITRDDQVKILDFGLAKPIEMPETDMTRGAGVMTNAGTVLGTFGYMAPEQVRGLAVDHRADMFAFGAVLYEMLSGDRAFKGETAADTMTAILTKDPPDLDTTRLTISPSLDRIVRRCLEKTPDLRFQSANDLAFALDTLSTTTTSTASAARVDVSSTRSVARSAWLPWTVTAAAVLSAAALGFFRPGPAEREAPWQRFTPVTEAAGEETSPTLSPDGTTVAYAIRVNGSWDIYAQRVGGRNATPIVNDPQRDEAAPAYSPDGSLIAFHESDQDGGIFIAGATGESVRRLSEIGFHPAWSPDGKKIAFNSEEIFDPASRQGGLSNLYVIDTAGGTRRQLVDGDAAQAAWSPSGERIAYWSNIGGQRDLFTVAATGGTPVAITADAPIDWSPVWSPDGRFVYFSSDRGGAMNLWRIAVDQSSGRVSGAAEPVTTGVQASAALPRFSKDGSRLAFRSRVGSINPVAVPFDPATSHAGVPVVLDGSNNIRVPSDVSPDGKQIAYFSIGERQEDAFIGGVDGTRMRRLTDDASRERAPKFTRDSRALVFYCNRDGNWAVWTVQSDGGGLRKIAGGPSGSLTPIPSPIDDRVVFSSSLSSDGVFTVPFSANPSTPPTLLPNTKTRVGYFSPFDWSHDGARLTGSLLSDSGRPAGVGVYDLHAHTTTQVSADETSGVRWLADGRRVVYFTKTGSELVVLDTVTHQRTVVPVQLPGPSTADVFAISPDNRMIYYGAVHAEADIWIAERK